MPHLRYQGYYYFPIRPFMFCFVLFFRSPIVFLENTFLCTNITLVYPCGHASMLFKLDIWEEFDHIIPYYVQTYLIVVLGQHGLTSFVMFL